MKVLAIVVGLTVVGGHPLEAQEPMDQSALARRFVAHFSDYVLNIQAAGRASISNASLSGEDTLRVDYAYQSEGEKRRGSLSLWLRQETHRFEGTWRTVADNGNVYQGTLRLRFKAQGEATGFYTFLGTNYTLTLSRR